MSILWGWFRLRFPWQTSNTEVGTHPNYGRFPLGFSFANIQPYKKNEAGTLKNTLGRTFWQRSKTSWPQERRAVFVYDTPNPPDICSFGVGVAWSRDADFQTGNPPPPLGWFSKKTKRKPTMLGFPLFSFLEFSTRSLGALCVVVLCRVLGLRCSVSASEGKCPTRCVAYGVCYVAGPMWSVARSSEPNGKLNCCPK